MPAASNTIAGLILAGGASRRLGYPKQLLPYGPRTLLGHILREAEAVPELDPLLVVLPPDREVVPDPAVLRARIVRRTGNGGCSSSLHAALQALPENVPALAVVPIDQVGLTRDLIAKAARTWLEDRPVAQVLSFRGQVGHPFIFASGLLERLAALHGEKGLWRLLEELGPGVARVPVDQPLPPDVDTWEDFALIAGSDPDRPGRDGQAAQE